MCQGKDCFERFSRCSFAAGQGQGQEHGRAGWSGAAKGRALCTYHECTPQTTAPANTSTRHGKILSVTKGHDRLSEKQLGCPAYCYTRSDRKRTWFWSILGPPRLTSCTMALLEENMNRDALPAFNSHPSANDMRPPTHAIQSWALL